ncbi:MAG: hypothetical protein KF772_04705 [Cryobacterium sp.]|nr:hypothetical protein [Cryobacterium sp.]
MTLQLDLERIAAAKLWLTSAAPNAALKGAPRDLPYLASALYALIPIAQEEVDRITCDEWWRIYINPSWLSEASVQEIGEELAHVTWHLLTDHANRARGMSVDSSTANHWKVASDMAVANAFDPEAFELSNLPRAADAGLAIGLSAEEYFASLSRLPVNDPPSGGSSGPQDGCGSGADGIPRSNELGPGSDVGGISAVEANEIRRQVAISYRDHIKKRGTKPGDDLRWIRQTLEPRVPWESLLSGAVRRAIGWAAGRGEYTYSRPSRRSSTIRGVVLPGQKRPVPRVSVIVDTSGSVDDELLARALGEVDGAISALGIPGANITIYSVDAAVHTIAKVRHALDARLVGAGGTDLRIGLKAAELERPRPEVIIVFTDGDTPWPTNPPPGSTVIAAILGRHQDELPPTPTWATRVECLVETWN